MLFDLQSPRRRFFIKIVYSGLALLIGGGLILGTFGSSGGGLLDSIGLGGGSSSGSGFEDQINEAQDKATAAPTDPTAQLELARVHFLAGNSQLTTDPDTGQVVTPAETTEEFQKTADAWAQYLKLLGNKPPNADVATLVSQAYVGLAQVATSASAADINIKGAAGAQQIVADNRPSQGAFSNLAIYLYFSGETAKGDAASAQAAELAPAAQKADITKQLADIKTQAAKFRKEIEDAAKQQASAGAGATPGAPPADPFQNPLQSQPSIGGTGLGG